MAPSAPGPVEQAAERQLAAAGRLDTVAGQLAVVLARRLDDSERDTGAGLAAVSKALRGVLDTLSAQDAPDLVDELKARRDLKRGRAS